MCAEWVNCQLFAMHMLWALCTLVPLLLWCFQEPQG